MVFSDAYVIIRIRNNPKGRCNMKYSFVKDFPGIGACDAYVLSLIHISMGSGAQLTQFIVPKVQQLLL